MIQKNVDAVVLTEPVTVFAMRSNGGYRIASQIRSSGYSCQTFTYLKYFSFNKNVKKFLETAVGPDTKLLCISTNFVNQDSFYIPGFQLIDFQKHYATRREFYVQVIDYAKSLNPNIKVVIGGYALDFFDKINVDIVVKGYGDKAVVELLKFLDNKNPFFQFTQDDSQGHNRMIIQGDSLNNSFDFQGSQTIYHATDYIQANEPLVIEIGRGCKFNCSFCNYRHVGKFDNSYIKHFESLRRELVRNYYEYGTTNYIVSDDTHNDNTFKLEQMAKLAQSLPFKFQFSAYLRIDLMRAHKEQYQLLKDAGLASAHFGIETLNHQAGKIIGKGLHPDKVIEELHNFRDQLPEVVTWGSFIVGLPGDTIETITKWTSTIADPEFPLDTISLHPLHVPPPAVFSKTYGDGSSDRLSDFAKNSEKYFTFNDKRDPLNWHNGDFNRNWTIRFAQNFHKQLLDNNRQSMGGMYAIALTMLDVPIESAKKKWFDLNLDVDRFVRARVKAYTKMLLEE
jgi:hypothetical protein